MEIELDFTETAQQNAARFYDEAKRLREKARRAGKAIAETEEKLRRAKEKAEAGASAQQPPAARVRREKQWFERFRWFYTSGGRLCIAGRDAKQNEAVVLHRLEPGDLFFHADIHGAPATVLKGGAQAPRKEKEEAAQFAASYSSAWKLGSASVDVYAVNPEQVSKRAESGESMGKGAFVIRGEREWFRNTPLGLVLGAGSEGVESAPASRGPGGMKSSAEIRPGGLEKGEAAKRIARALGGNASPDEILQALPSGNSSISRPFPA
ncbi:MAG: NFACT RNA binding domain-containing protein [Candidatus ainarchaeum sp.]|nr:NFACT RNA binding domain-containing protein [Candidatus ainarchaeum sp.]